MFEKQCQDNQIVSPPQTTTKKQLVFNNSTSDTQCLIPANNQTFLKLDIESLLTDLEKDHQQENKSYQQPHHHEQVPLNLHNESQFKTSHNSKNGIMTENFQTIKVSSSTCKSTITPIILPNEHLESDISNNLGVSRETCIQQPLRTVSNNNHQQQKKLFTIIQYDPQYSNNSEVSTQLTYHHISPQITSLSSAVVSDKKSKLKLSKLVSDNLKSERERNQPTIFESNVQNSNLSTFQWSENEFQEFTSGQHETQKRQRKEKVYRFYESSPTSFSNSEDPQSATSTLSNNSIFDSNSPSSPPLKKKKKTTKESQVTPSPLNSTIYHHHSLI